MNLRLSSSPNGTLNVFDVTKNMVTDYAADNTGVADVTSKYFTSLKADIQNKKALVISPAGTYNFSTFGGSSFINGAKDITLNNTGASWGPNGNFFLATDHIGQIGIDQGSGKSARIQTANIGDTSVTLTTASAGSGHISRFSVGQYMLVCGWSNQAGFLSPYSFPPNWQFLEFRKITAIVGNTLSFSGPLLNYYSSAWPEINRGSAFEVDAAGPASIFAISLFWNGTTTVNGGSYGSANNINCYRENFIMNGGTSTNLPIYPSVSKLYRAINHTATAALTEHDKLNETVDIQGGSYNQWKCQSASTRLLQMNGTTLGSLNGTPFATTLDNCTITGTTNIGPISYGRGDSFIARNTSFGGVINIGGVLEKGSKIGVTDPGVQGYIFMSGGVMTIPMSMGDSATRTLMPLASGKHVLHWQGSGGTFGSFKVLSATADSWPAVDNQIATTNVTIANGSYSLAVSSAIFASGDVNKVIVVPNGGASGNLNTFITAFTDSQHVTLYDACTNASGLSASSQTLQWGTCNMYVTTDQAGGLPNSLLYPSGLYIRVPAARSVRFDTCIGTGTAAQQAQIADLTQPAAWDLPLFSYTKRTYDGTTGATGAPSVTVAGQIVSIKVNVTKAYTGAGTLTMGFTQFDNMTRYVAGATSFGTYGPRFNLKNAAQRTIIVGTTTGAQVGDTNLDITTASWFGTTFGVSMSRDISGEVNTDWPSFTVEFILDQGFS